MALAVLLENALEGLLENGRVERIGQNHETARAVDHGSHFQQTNLIKTACENINGVAIDGSSLGQCFIKLGGG